MGTGKIQEKLSIGLEAQQLLGTVVDRGIERVLDQNSGYIQQYFNNLLLKYIPGNGNQFPINRLLSQHHLLIVPTNRSEEFRAEVCFTISQLLYNQLPQQNNYEYIFPVNEASQTIYNQYLNEGCFEEALKLPVLNLNRKGNAYEGKTKIGGKFKRYYFEFGEMRSQAEALRLALEARAKIQEAQRSYANLVRLEKKGIVEHLDGNEFKIKGMYIKDSDSNTQWIYIKNGKIELGRSLEKNFRGFEIGFQRIILELFKKIPNLTQQEQKEIKLLNNEGHYSVMSDKQSYLHEIGFILNHSKLESLGILDRNTAGQLKLSGLSIERGNNDGIVKVNFRANEYSDSRILNSRSFERVYDETLKKWIEKRSKVFSKLERRVIGSLNTQQLYEKESPEYVDVGEILAGYTDNNK